MIEIQIDSSNIKSLFYNEINQELIVFFNSNSLYIYYDVNPKIIEKLRQSTEKGRFFSEYIRDSFNYKRKY